MYASTRPQHTCPACVGPKSQRARAAGASAPFEAPAIVVIGFEVMGVFRIAATLPRATWLCAALCLLRVSPAVAASDEEKAGARAAATQGQAAYDNKRWAESLDLFTRAESLVHSPVHLLYKARSLAQLGQLVKAREAYLAVTRDDSATTSPAVLKAREDAAKEVSQIEPRLASLTVKVDGPGAAEANVEMDGVKVPIALVGVARPADPGQHIVQASANGAAADPQTVTLKEGGSATITLVLKPVAGATPLVPPPTAQPANSPP